jgi:hypothetical protein
MNAAMGHLFASLVSRFFDCVCFLVTTSWWVVVRNYRRKNGQYAQASQANRRDFPAFGVTRVTVRGRPEVLSPQMSEGVRISHEKHTIQ